MRARLPSRAAALAGCLLVSACVAHDLPASSSTDVPLAIGRTATVTQVNGYSTVVIAAEPGAADVRCEAWPAGSPEQSRALGGHYTEQTRTIVPTERGGREFYPVGTVPVPESGRSTVACSGPADTDVVIVVGRPAEGS